LTHDVIHDQTHRNVIHVIGEGLAKAIVHVYLPGGGDELSPTIKCFTDDWTHLSPFWKSTTDVGTKNPWQHAVAPMPVTSR
jgi:hypothetical protein